MSVRIPPESIDDRWDTFERRLDEHPEASRYPQLKGLDPFVADRWLIACRRQMVQRMPMRPRVVRAACIGLAAVAGTAVVMTEATGRGSWELLIPVLLIAGVSAAILSGYLSERYVETYVGRRLAEEVSRGRYLYCVECDFDLRGSPGETCPECGASTVVPNARAYD